MPQVARRDGAEHAAVEHEFRNSLATITSCTLTLLDDAASFPAAPSADLVAMLRRQVRRIEWLLAALEPIEDLQGAPRRRVDARRVVADACASFDVPLTMTAPNVAIPVVVDPAQLTAGVEILIVALAASASVDARLHAGRLVVRSSIRDTAHPSVRWKLARARALFANESLRLRVRTTARGTVATVDLAAR